jgi:hypothetical protein
MGEVHVPLDDTFLKSARDLSVNHETPDWITGPCDEIRNCDLRNMNVRLQFLNHGVRPVAWYPAFNGAALSLRVRYVN